MGNKQGSYDELLQETKELLMQRTGKKISKMKFTKEYLRNDSYGFLSLEMFRILWT